MMKEINGFDDYFIDEEGRVYSKKSGKLTELSPCTDSKGLYLAICIIDNHGKRKGKLIHRLVAEAFIENPRHLPEVNHKDKNVKNCRVENLEWCTHKDNLYDSYETMSPVRNYRKCCLYKGGVFVSEFKSVHEACEYAAKNYDSSLSSLIKYRRCGDVSIVAEKSDVQNPDVNHVYRTRRKRNV